jgi:ubiquitin C-terminal hydrolase
MDNNILIELQRNGLYVRGLSGLNNIGNTCYMNSVIQCLASSLFTAWFKSKRYMNDLSCENGLLIEKTLTHNLAKLLEAMWKENCTINPYMFKQIVGEIKETFKGANQHDCQEFLNFILDRIHEETKYEAIITPNNISASAVDFYDNKKMFKENNVYELYKKQYKKDYITSKAYGKWKSYVEKSYSIIIELFTGSYYSIISCSNCDYYSNKFDAFSTLSLSIPDKGETTLYRCLEDHFKEEILVGDNQYFCKKCNKKNDGCTKKLYIWDPPELLIIQLKRFDSQNNKTTSKIIFPIFDFNLKSAQNDIHITNSTYDLWAICKHENNTTTSGHYIAYCKNMINKKWYKFNDDHILHIPDDKLENEIITKNAYILFYAKK